jgi:DNA polymerase III subunit epsilon
MTSLLANPTTPAEAGASSCAGLDFVAIDVETANARRGSICAIGATVVRAGKPVAIYSWLTRPPRGLDDFAGINVSVHGITPDMVAHQPAFTERLDQLLKITDGLPLVAHNAAFDIGALREACMATGRAWPTTDYACSLMMARRALDLISYRLPIVAAECGVGRLDHHEPGSDALSCALIVLEIARRRNVCTLRNLCADLQMLAGRLETTSWRGCRGALTASSTPPEAAADADPAHPLYGQVMVFTGTLGIRRQDAWDAVARCGAAAEKGVTKRTTMLVVGDGFTGNDPADFWTGKAARAARWRQKGHQIEVLTEIDLIDLLAESHTAGIRDSLTI